jgi:hypothetical protein
MKAFFIDAQKNEVTPIETTGGIDDIKKIISVKHITTIRPALFSNDIIFVDDEGLLNGTKYGFEINGIKVYGDGLILGIKNEDVCSVSEGDDVQDYNINFFILKQI